MCCDYCMRDGKDEVDGSVGLDPSWTLAAGCSCDGKVDLAAPRPSLTQYRFAYAAGFLVISAKGWFADANPAALAMISDACSV